MEAHEIDVIDYRIEFALETVKMWRRSFQKAMGLEEQDHYNDLIGQLNFFSTIGPEQIPVAIEINNSAIVGLMVLDGHEPDHLYAHVDCQRLGIPFFHNHLTVDLVKALFDFGTEPFIQLRADVWRKAFEASSIAKQSFVFTFNPEATVDPALMIELADKVEQAGGTMHYIELICSNDEFERRIGNESRKKFGKLTDAALYREIREQGGFEFPQFPRALISIDTEQADPNEAASKIAEALTNS